jgi:hypothetical protein
MRILHTLGQDPMVLDSLRGMNATHERLRQFLISNERSIAFKCECSGSPAPYSEFLGALNVEVREGPIVVSIAGANSLQIEGSRENLAIYASHFAFRESEEGAHHHPEYLDRSGYVAPNSLSIIIEVNTDHVEELEGES